MGEFTMWDEDTGRVLIHVPSDIKRKVKKRVAELDECCENERDEQYMHDQFRKLE